jgi:hypothetical protein
MSDCRCQQRGNENSIDLSKRRRPRKEELPHKKSEKFRFLMLPRRKRVVEKGKGTLKHIEPWRRQHSKDDSKRPLRNECLIMVFWIRNG